MILLSSVSLNQIILEVRLVYGQSGGRFIVWLELKPELTQTAVKLESLSKIRQIITSIQVFEHDLNYATVLCHFHANEADVGKV